MMFANRFSHSGHPEQVKSLVEFGLNKRRTAFLFRFSKVLNGENNISVSQPFFFYNSV